MKTKEYRIKEEYIGTALWYMPQVKCKFLWWTYWDSIGNFYRHKHDAEEKRDSHIVMLENPVKSNL